MTSQNQPKLFEIDPEILKMNDPRIILLKNGEMSQLEFMRLIRMDDPFNISGGRLFQITPEMELSQKNGYVKSVRDNLMATGGMQPSILLDNPAFAKLYPEIRSDIEAASADISKANCQGCEKNRKLQPILMKLMAIPYDGRDLTELKNALPESAMLKLTGKLTREYVESMPMAPPPHLSKRRIDAVDEINPSLIQNPMIMVRPECEDCFKKHIGAAIILMMEAAVGGYTSSAGYLHEDLAASHASEAMDEILKKDQTEAAKLKAIIERMNAARQSDNQSARLSAIEDLHAAVGGRFIGFDRTDLEIVGLLNRLEELAVLTDKNIESAKKIRDVRLMFTNQTRNAPTN